MSTRSILNGYANWFNGRDTFWSVTKGTTVTAASPDKLVRYHRILKERVIDAGVVWNAGTQQMYGNAVAGRIVSTAWARELRTVFALLGTAWVQDDGKVKLTPVGEELLRRPDPRALLERQVWKYQLTNPQLSETLTQDIQILPHCVLLDLLLDDNTLQSLSRDEFVFFVARVRNAEDLPRVREALLAYREAVPSLQANFRSRLDRDLLTKIGQVFSYAANFLAFPRYLKYGAAQISVVQPSEARQVLSWFHSGHDQYIQFQTPMDWFSHYGDLEATPSPLEAMSYYRKMGRAKEAAVAFGRAVRVGLVPPAETENDFQCRVEGESALETWLVAHLARLEKDLLYIKRQYETEDAGRIDILARDPTGDYVVIELKRDVASDVAMGQLLRYIGWVRMNLSEGGPVRGYVVGDSFDNKMIYALLSNDALDQMCKLREYKDLGIRLEITRSHELCTAQVIELPLTG